MVISVKEKGVPFINAQTFVCAGDKSDAGVEIQAALRSPLGHGEHIRLASVTSAVSGREHIGQLTIPHLNGAWSISAKSGEEQPVPWLSYRTSVQSLQVQYKPDARSKHELVAEYALRDEIPNSAKSDFKNVMQLVDKVVHIEHVPASESVLNLATSSIKASIKHIWTAIDEPQLTETGESKFLQSSVELASGLGSSPGVAEFLKTELVARYERQLGPNIFAQPGVQLSLGGNLGAMFPLALLAPMLSRREQSLKPYTSYLCDRYHLGGPLSLRGFAPGGVGPRSVSQKDSLGGDTKASMVALLSVPVPVPSLAAASMRAFVFANAGGIGSADNWASQASMEGMARIMPSFGKMRASVGAGLSLMMADKVRVEGSYSFPLIKAKHDNTTAFQLGIGLSIN